MQALTLPASRGWHWLTDGFALFRRKPFQLSFLVLGYWISMALVNAIPLVGQIVGFMLIPAFSVSLMNACRQLDRRGDASPPLLFSGFHKNLPTLVSIGLVYCAISIVVLAITALVDGGVLFRLIVLGENPGAAGLTGGDVMAAGQLALVLLLPIMMANWYAPVLVAWHDLHAAKALFFSFIACLRNWRAFIVYTGAVIVVGVLVPGIAVSAVGALAGGAAEMFSSVVTVFFVAILLPTLYASFYVSYRDVFVTGGGDA